MKICTKNFNFVLALFICFSLIIACDGKKEDTKTSSSSGSQVYFVLEYTSKGEVGKGEKFYIAPEGGYITAILKMEKPIGVGTVDLRFERETVEGHEIVNTQPFDVSPDANYMHFDKIVFYKSGDFRVTIFKKDGTPIASGKVRIDYK